jgi:hypothetical protein
MKPEVARLRGQTQVDLNLLSALSKLTGADLVKRRAKERVRITRVPARLKSEIPLRSQDS